MTGSHDGNILCPDCQRCPRPSPAEQGRVPSTAVPGPRAADVEENGAWGEEGPVVQSSPAPCRGGVGPGWRPAVVSPRGWGATALFRGFPGSTLSRFVGDFGPQRSLGGAGRGGVVWGGHWCATPNNDPRKESLGVVIWGKQGNGKLVQINSVAFQGPKSGYH